MPTVDASCLSGWTHHPVLFGFIFLHSFSLPPPPQSLLATLFGCLQRKGGVRPLTPAALPLLAACNLSWQLPFTDLSFSVALPNNERLAHELWGRLLWNGNMATPPSESKDGAWNVSVWKVKVNGVQDFYKSAAILRCLIKPSEVQMAGTLKDANYRFKCFCLAPFS